MFHTAKGKQEGEEKENKKRMRGFKANIGTCPYYKDYKYVGN